jgi:hypothetical protein
MKMGKPRNSRFISFSDKETLKKLFSNIRPVSDQSKAESIEKNGNLKSDVMTDKQEI